MLTQEPIYKPSLIFYFKPILLSAHKLTLLIYGDNRYVLLGPLGVRGVDQLLLAKGLFAITNY